MSTNFSFETYRTIYGSVIGLHQNRETYYVKFRYDPTLLREIKSYADRKWHPENKVWSFPVSIRNMIKLYTLIGMKSQLLSIPNIKNILLSQEEPIPKLHTYKLPSDLVEDLKQRGIKPWGQQKEMILQLINKPRSILSGQMRVGKTLATLISLNYITKIKTKNPRHRPQIMWVCPASTILSLENEVRKWKFDLNLSIMSYNKFRTTFKGTTDPFLMYWVFDEAQALKSIDSIQGKTAQAMMTSLTHNTEVAFLTLLSGTPAPKAPDDWWNLLEVTVPGFLPESSKYAFRERLGVFEEIVAFAPNGNEHKFKQLKHWISEQVIGLYGELQMVVGTYLLKDSFDLPERMYEVVDLSITDKKALRKQKILVKRLMKRDDKPVTTQLRLSQLSDGFMTFTDVAQDGSVSERVEHYPEINPKIKRLRTDLQIHLDSEECPRIIVLAHFTPSVDLCASLAEEMGYKVIKISKGHMTNSELLGQMDNSIKEKSTEPIAVVAQVDSASMGLELSASNQIIYYSNSFNGGSRIQSESRAYSNNMDKVKGLMITDYCNLPIDNFILENVKTKKKLLKMSMGEIKNIFSEFIKDES